jgi:hypothetical protein
VVGANISLNGGPHNWNGCTTDCLGNHPWNSLDWAPADGKVYASHGGIAHILDCQSISGHRSFVRVDYNDGSGYQVSYEHIHNVDVQISDGQSVTRGQYLGNTSTDSNCGGYATGVHTHMSLWHFTSGTWTGANSQAVDMSGVQVGAWLVDDGSPTQEQYTGCISPVLGGTRQCPQTTVYNSGSSGTPCTSITASAQPASPQGSGTQVSITGAATCPSGSPFYEFWARWQGGATWQLLQGYSTSNVYHWNSTGALSGTETFSVWAIDAKSVGNGGCNTNEGCYDTYVGLSYTITTGSCAWVGISASPTTVAHSSSNGTHVTASAIALGCTNPSPLYQFLIRPASQTNWQIVQTYSTSATYDWNSTGAAVGTVYLGAWVKDAASLNSYDAVASTPVSVT